MSLFEHFIERRWGTPKPTGTLSVRPPDHDPSHLGVRCLVSAALVGLWVWLAIDITETAAQLAAFVLGSITYVVAGAVVHPEPEMSNLGIRGTIFNHPFRFSDNINRFLLFLRTALAPGRYVGTTAVDVWRLSRAEDPAGSGQR